MVGVTRLYPSVRRYVRAHESRVYQAGQWNCAVKLKANTPTKHQPGTDSPTTYVIQEPFPCRLTSTRPTPRSWTSEETPIRLITFECRATVLYGYVLSLSLSPSHSCSLFRELARIIALEVEVGGEKKSFHDTFTPRVTLLFSSTVIFGSLPCYNFTSQWGSLIHLISNFTLELCILPSVSHISVIYILVFILKSNRLIEEGELKFFFRCYV